MDRNGVQPPTVAVEAAHRRPDDRSIDNSDEEKIVLRRGLRRDNEPWFIPGRGIWKDAIPQGDDRLLVFAAIWTDLNVRGHRATS